MDPESRMLRQHATADLVAALVLGVAAVIAGGDSDPVTDYTTVTFLLWALAAAAAARGIVHLVALGLRVYRNP